MVPEEGGATRQAELIAQSIHDNLCAGTTRHCHTNTKILTTYLSCQEGWAGKARL